MSTHAGRERCNDFSIGVELEGSDDVAYTHSQYETLCEFVRLARDRWTGIDETRVVGHCHIAAGRKTDPGEAFDWARLRAGMR